MQVLYKSTRGKEQAVTASMAILKGLSEDGGLVPLYRLSAFLYQLLYGHRRKHG